MRDSQDSTDPRDAQDSMDPRDSTDPRDSLDPSDEMDFIDVRQLKDSPNDDQIMTSSCTEDCKGKIKYSGCHHLTGSLWERDKLITIIDCC